MKDKASPLQGLGSVRGLRLAGNSPPRILSLAKPLVCICGLELVSLFLLPMLGFSQVKGTLLSRLGPSVSWSSLLAWLGNVHRGSQK